MTKRTSGEQALADALFPVAASLRLERGPDDPAVWVWGAVLADLTKPRARRRHPAIAEVMAVLENLAAEWRQTHGPDYPPLGDLTAVLWNLDHGRFTPPRKPRRPAT